MYTLDICDFYYLCVMHAGESYVSNDGQADNVWSTAGIGPTTFGILAQSSATLGYAVKSV